MYFLTGYAHALRQNHSPLYPNTIALDDYQLELLEDLHQELEVYRQHFDPKQGHPCHPDPNGCVEDRDEPHPSDPRIDDPLPPLPGEDSLADVERLEDEDEDNEAHALSQVFTVEAASDHPRWNNSYVGREKIRTTLRNHDPTSTFPVCPQVAAGPS